MGYRCSKSLFRDYLGTVPEKVPVSGFKRNWSNLDRAAKIRDSVLLNCSDSSPATLPSVFSETCVKNSSVILESNVLCAWLFLVFSCVSFETTANFYLFFNVAIILEESKAQQLWKLNLFFISKLNWDCHPWFNSLLQEGKCFRISNSWKWKQLTKITTTVPKK